jgi:hypothetical protein
MSPKKTKEPLSRKATINSRTSEGAKVSDGIISLLN